MDPDAALRQYRAALAAGDAQEAEEALDDLRQWRDAGGFPPADGWPAGL